MECLKCQKKIDHADVTTTCCDCKRFSHSTCTKLTIDEIRLHREKGVPWRCRACTKQKLLNKDESKRKSSIKEKGMGDTKTEEFKHDSDPSMNNICKPTADGDSEAAMNKGEDASVASESLNELKMKNAKLAKEIETLAYRLDMTEQNLKRNTLEICGIPDKKNENLLTVMKQIGSAIDFPLRDEMIDACYRINRQSKNGSHNIVLTFVRRFDKEGFLKCYRQKKTLNTKDLGKKEDSVIIIRESLSLSKQHILLETRKVVKQLNYQGVGVVNGEVFVKKSESIPAILIRDLKDLEKLVNPNKFDYAT